MAPSHFPLQDTTRQARHPDALTPTDRTIPRFLSHCHRRRYSARKDVFRPGDAANTMYYVISGSLSVLSEEEDGRELVLSYINAGEFVGETGIFISAPQREVVLRTRSVCELAEISYERLLELMSGSLSDDAPRLLYAIGSHITRRLLHTGRKASRLAFMDVTNRIAKSLLELCQEPDALSHPEGTQIRVSRQELSRIVGCSREMAGRVIKQLEEQGFLRARGKTMVILADAKRR